jgi:hypothetical protein
VGPAQASIDVTSFSLSPSTTQAGGTTSQPGPDLTLDAQFSHQGGDTVKDAKISLAPGILANPSVVPLCSAAQFQADNCPDASRIGHGVVTGTAPSFWTTLNLPADLYLVQPQGSEAARVGLVVTFFDYPVVSQTAPVAIRSTPDVGLDIPLTSIPHQFDGVDVTVDSLHLTIFGSVGGRTFTRNATSCASLANTLTVDSWGAPSTQITKQSPYQATGCSSLPYTPTIAGTVTKDSADDGLAFDARITQTYAEADTHSVLLTLPHSMSPRLSLLASACTASDLTTCPSIGSATVTTPLLSNPITAKIVLVAHTGSIPTLAVLVPQPFGIEIDATPILSGDSVQALVVGIPDVPISNLTLDLAGGSSSLFRAGVHLCSTAQQVSGNFTAWSGATATPSAAATVIGCPANSPATLGSRELGYAKERLVKKKHGGKHRGKKHHHSARTTR